MASVAEWTELAIATRDPEFFGRLALVSTLPSYACRPEIRANVVAAIDGREPVRNGQHWAVKRNTKQNRGATLFGATGKPAEAFNPDEPSLFPKDWTGDAVSRGFLEKFLALAESRQVPVFWLVPPIMPKAQAHRSAVGAEARYTRFIEETAARFRNVTVVDARSSAYAPEAFNDTTHLNLDGRGRDERRSRVDHGRCAQSARRHATRLGEPTGLSPRPRRATVRRHRRVDREGRRAWRGASLAMTIDRSC